MVLKLIRPAQLVFDDLLMIRFRGVNFGCLIWCLKLEPLNFRYLKTLIAANQVQVQVCLLTPLNKQKNKTDKTENE